MPAKVPKPRIAIYLKPHVYETIKRLSELGGEPMSRIIADLVESVGDPLMRTVALLEAASAAPKQIKEGLRGTLEAVERDLYGAAGYAMGQMDWLINEMGKPAAGHAPGGASATGGAGAAAGKKPRAKAKSNPHTVIRGSGQAKPLKSKETGVSGKRLKKGAKNG